MSKTDFTPKDRLIVAQVAAKGAVDLLANGDLERTPANFRRIAAMIDGAIWELVASTPTPSEGAQPADNVVPITNAPSSGITDDELKAQIEAEFGATEDVTPPEATVPPMPPYTYESASKAERGLIKEWALKRLEVAPDEFWDNRPKKAAGEYKPSAPDFKHKDSDTPVWVN